MEDDMEAGVMQGVIGITVWQIVYGNGFLIYIYIRHYIRDYTRLQDGPLRPLQRVPS